MNVEEFKLLIETIKYLLELLIGCTTAIIIFYFMYDFFKGIFKD